MKNKKLNLFLLSTILLASCGKEEDSISNTTNSESTLPEVSSSETSDKQDFVEITNVNDYFTTYANDTEYNYIVDFTYQVVQSREYIGGNATEYMYDGHNIQIDYESNNSNFVDYLVENDAGELVYYLDDGSQKKYQYLDQNNEYFFNYYSTVDRFELAGIDWEEDFVFDLQNKVCKPANQEALTNVCKEVFGDNSSEYWEKLEISWNDNYLTHIDAISIASESVFYFDIDIREHGYATVDVSKLNATKYVNPNQPYFKDREEYIGVALNDAQKAVFNNLFTSANTMNYTASVLWTLVKNGQIYEDYKVENKLRTNNGIYEYTYEASTGLINIDYLISNEDSISPTYYLDSGDHTNYTIYGYGMDNYEAYLSSVYFDRVRLYDIDASDFIYNEKEGYLMPKDADTDAKLCAALFQYPQNYSGVHIYLKENDDFTLSIDKIVTSAYVLSGKSAVSVIKTYTFTNWNSTEITLPEGVA